MTKTTKKRSRVNLTRSAAQVNTEYKSILANTQDSLTRAKSIGDILIKVKAATEHGDYLPWIKANCTFSERSAQRFVYIAEHWDVLPKALDSNDKSHYQDDESIDSPTCSINEACQAIRSYLHWLKRYERQMALSDAREAEANTTRVADLSDHIEPESVSSPEIDDAGDECIHEGLQEYIEEQQAWRKDWRNDKVRQNAIDLETRICNMMKGSVFTGNKSHEQCQISMQRVIDFIQRILDKGKA